ncbi:MAG: DUF6291 domain-containing protein [Elusimicrobiota bacterium]|nr:DUF6291 domain-containing protein [Elusimicrobiota bacterium]
MNFNNLNSFLLFNKQIEFFLELSDEEAGKIIKAVFLYVNNKNIPELPDKLKYVYIAIRQIIDLNKEKYINKCEINKKNVETRWNLKDTK